MPNGHPINLIRVFDFYLALMFVISLVRRWEVYWDAVRIIFVVRGRWPRLMSRLAEHGSMLLNWEFFRPAMLALGLMLIQMICSRVIWPDADLSSGQLREEWLWFAVVLAAVVPMLAVDVYFVVSVGRFDHSETVKYLDQAETWLGWRGPLVKIATLGMVNPSQMVDRRGPQEHDRVRGDGPLVAVVGVGADRLSGAVRARPVGGVGGPARGLRMTAYDADAANRVWQHGMHEEQLFHNRLNYFSFLETGLLSLCAILFNKEPSLTLFVPLTVVGLLFTLLWLLIQTRHWAYCQHVHRRARELVPTTGTPSPAGPAPAAVTGGRSPGRWRSRCRCCSRSPGSAS